MFIKFPLEPLIIFKEQEAISEDSSNEALIWKKFKEGDKDAYSFIYKKYFEIIFRYGRKINPDRDLVKDSIHDLFVELWKNKDRLGEPTSIKNYLLKSIRRKLYRISSKSKFFTQLENIENYQKNFISSHEAFLIDKQSKQDLKEKLFNALNKLTKRQKEAVYLIFYEKLSYQEVSSIMSLKVRTVYNVVFNAIKVLKINMDPH
ncbi:RNA polymerase sigma-70 factor [soil metagenome]